MIPLTARGNLLVILFNGYGDAFLALPVMRQIIRRFRRHKVYFACFEFQIKTLFNDLDVNFVAGKSVDEKILLDEDLDKLNFEQLVSLNAYYPNPVELEIHKLYPDVPRWGFCDFDGAPFPKFQAPSMHMREQYFEVVGWPPSYSLPQRRVRVLPETQERFDDFFLQCAEGGSQRFYTLHIDSLREKMWGLKNWFLVVEHLRSRWNLSPLILGEETPEAERLIEEFSFARKLPSSLGIDVHFAAVEAAKFFIGIDSIFAHVADSLQKRMVVLFGPSDDINWGPSNPDSIIVKPRRGNLMDDIEPEEVMRSLDKIFTE